MHAPRTLLEGFGLVESPRWHDGRLWFSDWSGGTIVATDLDGNSETVARDLPMPFSIAFAPDGRLIVVSGPEARVLRREPDGTMETLAELAPLGPPHWNDVVVDGRGNTYTGSVDFGSPDREFTPGIIALVTPDGKAEQVADGAALANGIAVTPDNATLILAESYGNRLSAWDVDEAGGLANRRVWADLGDGVPDGICVDAEGAVWYADVPNQRCVRVREGGEVLATVAVDRGCFACALGGPERETLFILAAEFRGFEAPVVGGKVLTVEAPAPGAGWP